MNMVVWVESINTMRRKREVDSSMTTHVFGLQYSIYISMIFMSESMILFFCILSGTSTPCSFTLFLHMLFVINRYMQII